MPDCLLKTESLLMNLLGFACVLISAGLWRSSAVGFKVSNRQMCARSNSMKLASSSVPYKLNFFVLFWFQFKSD